MEYFYSNKFKFFLVTLSLSLCLIVSNAYAKVIINDNMMKSNISHSQSNWQDALLKFGLPASDIVHDSNTIKTKLSNNFLTQFGYSGFLIPKDEYTAQTAVGKDEVLMLETIVSYQLKGAENNAFGEPKDSIRNGTAGIIMVNLATGQTNCVFFSNEGIYLFNDSTGVRLYNSAKRVADYTPNEVVSLKQEYDRKNNELRWYVNGQLVGKVISEKIGFPGFANFNGLPPHPITNPGQGQSEKQSSNSVNLTDLPGQWFVGPFLGLAFADLNFDGSGEGLIPVDEFAGETYTYPTSFKTTLATASSDIDRYYRNISANNPEGKSITIKVYKFKLSVRKAK